MCKRSLFRLKIAIIFCFLPIPSVADNLTDSDMLFDWAEQSYAELLRPPSAASQHGGGYYFRCYTVTNNCLGSRDDELFYYEASHAQLLGLGSLSGFLGQVGRLNSNTLIPRFVKSHFIDLDKIESISRFRSSEGHDFSVGGETCRSMKHYFTSKSTLDAATVKIYSPVDGIVTLREDEWVGTRFKIQSDEYPDYTFIIFHVDSMPTIVVGSHLVAGQQIGALVGWYAGTDIAVEYGRPDASGFWKNPPQFVSFFDVMSDASFADLVARGIQSRTSLIISKAERDSHPLTCDDKTHAFIGPKDAITVNRISLK